MKQEGTKWGIIFLGIGLLLSISIYLLLTPARAPQTSETVAPPAPFGGSNINNIKVDTFLSLIHKSHGSLATTTLDNNKLTVDLKGNELTKDFFNGNDGLLQYDLNDHGFEIKYNPEQKTMVAVFTINNNGVQVPNDVMIKLLDKTLNK